VDTGVREGDEIGVHYDPMIAKLICWDVDRGAALRRLRQALADYQVAGLATNLEFLSAVTAHRAFARAHEEPGLLDTGLIERYSGELFPAREPVPDAVLAVAVLAQLREAERRSRAFAAVSGDPHSPWHATDGWRLNEDNFHVFRFLDGERHVAVTAHYRDDGYALDLPGGSVRARATDGPDGGLVVDLDGARSHAHVVRRGESLAVFAFGRTHARLGGGGAGAGGGHGREGCRPAHPRGHEDGAHHPRAFRRHGEGRVLRQGRPGHRGREPARFRGGVLTPRARPRGRAITAPAGPGGIP
jgi:3-methylcrotonyl-CoA carboxylase alpha subunit